MAAGQENLVTTGEAPRGVAGLPETAGRYALLLDVPNDVRVRVRSGRRFDIAAGSYAYVGSAMGPGGLSARVRRYLGTERRPHWHIDYLLEAAEVRGVLCFSRQMEECRLAGLLAATPRVQTIDGFGCSDCACRSHLLWLPGRISAAGLVECLARLDAGLRALLLVSFQPEPTRSRPPEQTDERL